VRSGISDQLGQLVAERDENILHKPLSPIEGAALYREIKAALADEVTRHSPRDEAEGGLDGVTVTLLARRSAGRIREQAALMVTGRLSHNTFERINHLRDLAADPSQPQGVRQRAAEELAGIEAGGSVKAAHERINALVSPATATSDTERLAVPNAILFPTRAFITV
jgi:ParB family chromosome partitioning protein